MSTNKMTDTVEKTVKKGYVIQVGNRLINAGDDPDRFLYNLSTLSTAISGVLLGCRPENINLEDDGKTTAFRISIDKGLLTITGANGDVIAAGLPGVIVNSIRESVSAAAKDVLADIPDGLPKKYAQEDIADDLAFLEKAVSSAAKNAKKKHSGQRVQR